MIPDAHEALTGWGVHPVLFDVGGHPVMSYSVLVTFGLVAAVLVYWLNTRGKTVGNNALYIAIAAAAGGVLGAKLPIWVAHIGDIIADPGRWELILSGRTIVGGIIGGALAVYLVKRRLGITERLGNYLVPSLALGVFFGRIGCFLAGCCYGTVTTLPWGIDFGDGLLRHPTQLYEALLVFGIFVYAQLAKERYEPGKLFGLFMVAYFGWRFLVEFIRVNPVAAAGLTYYQVASALVVVHYVVRNAGFPSVRGSA